MLAAAVGLPVLYVASFGPACWISSHTLDDKTNFEAQTVSTIYQPILSVAWDGPPRARDSMVWYALLWSKKSWTISWSSGRVHWGRMPL
jgi:hypothetical protein